MVDAVGSAGPVLIVGAGPVGLSTALALARHGVRTTVLEQDASTSERSKAPGVHVRTREALRQWGIADDFVATGTLRQRVRLHTPTGDGALLELGFDELDDEADRPGLLVIEQGDTERLLLRAVQGSGRCDVRFGSTAVAVEQGPDGVTVTARENGRERRYEAEYVVGCDGADSFVRGEIGQSFGGSTYALRPMLADVTVADERDDLPWPRTFNGRRGLTTTLRLRPGLWRIIWLYPGDDDPGEVTDEEVHDRVSEVLGPGPVEVTWASRFRIHRRSSPRFRVGRVLLAGDAAHIHSPVGGLGMNAGIQDAHNLGWKLAYAVRGGDRDRLLDSYEVERQAVAVESVSRYTDLLTRLFLLAPTTVRNGAFAAARLATAIAPVRRQILRRAAMLDLGYPPSPLLRRGDRAAGTRVPNVSLRSPGGAAVRLHDLLGYQPALIDSSDQPEVGEHAAIDSVIRVGAQGYQDPSGQLARLTAGRPAWTLIRPDGHVAWSLDRPHNINDAIAHALGGCPAS